MSFVYSCIGDNTPENREHLEKVGYKLAEGMSIDAKYLYAYLAFSGEYCYYSHNDRQAPIHVVNCIGNPQLFRAVTAIRDDSDYLQWFFYGETFFLCELEDIRDFRRCKSIRKASLAELQEHFKLNETGQ